MKLAHRLVLQSVIVVIALALAVAIFVESARPYVLAASTAALLTALVLSGLVTRYVSRPVTQLRDMAKGLANHELRTIPAVQGPGEIGELAGALHQLSGQLEALETTRRDFVANVSHELRTPLTVVGGFAETLADDPDLPAANRQQFAKSILVNTRRMQRIVDDLLDLSRIESGGWIPRPVDTDLRVAIAEAIALVQDAAHRKGLTLTSDIPDEASRATIDRTALRQILTNLSENAIRHTPSGGTITVFTNADRGGVWLGVRDTGEGIAPEHVTRVFERFYRVDTGRSRDAGGTGLGLSIVRHLAEAHGGTVHATSEVGQGTTIRAFFPARAADR